MNLANVQNEGGRAPLNSHIISTDISTVDRIVIHIAKLVAIGSYVSQSNLQRINASRERKSNYLQHLQIYKKAAQMIKERNESLYDFLRENDVNKMVGIWEKNENVRNEFDNKKNLKKLYPEYAHILINQANQVKKEIFLHNHKSLINVLSKDFQNTSFTVIKNSFVPYRNDYSDIRQETGVTLMHCLDFEDVKERHVPKLKVKAFAEIIQIKDVNSSLKYPSIEQSQELSRACS